MSTQAYDFEYTNGRDNLFTPMSKPLISDMEASSSEDQTILAINNLWLSGMAKVPENISDVIVKKLAEVDTVKAILMGRSGEVHHVWTMIGDWSSSGRKSVYAAQKELLVMLKGFELDFYVVPLEEGISPDAMVSDIPLVFQRAS